MQENGLNKFRTIVSEVSSFVGNPVGPVVSLGKMKNNFYKKINIYQNK